MFEPFGTDGLVSASLWIGQVSAPSAVNTLEGTDLLFSGPRFFTALLSGILLALGFQLLLTNLSVAAGISYLGHQGHSDADSSGNLGSTIRKIGFGFGLWTLVTISVALFAAAFLSVKLTLLIDPLLGATVGLVIWAAYFCLLAWFSSTTVGSMVGSVMNSVTSGFQAMMGSATAMLGGKIAGDRVVATAEAAASAVRRELTGSQDFSSLRDKVEDYIEMLRPPELDTQKIRYEFEELLRDPELLNLGSSEALSKINRDTFVDLVSSRTDLSRREVERLADQLHASWQKFTRQLKPGKEDPLSDFQHYVSSALPDQLRSSDLGQRIDQLISKLTSGQRDASSSEQQGGIVNQALQLGMTALMGTVMGRQDLSDLDVEKILGQLRGARDKAMQQTDKLLSTTSEQSAEASASTIRSDVEHYLSTAYSWQMNAMTIERDFREILRDPSADPASVRQQLEAMNRDEFTQLLRQRGVFTQDRIAEITEQLEKIRTEVIKQLKQEEQKEQIQDLLNRVGQYLKFAPKQELMSVQAEHDFSNLFQASNADLEVLQSVLNQLTQESLLQLLAQRQDLEPGELTQLQQQVPAWRDRLVQEVEARQLAEDSQTKALQLRVENYLKNTHKTELNPEGIKRDLQTLFQDPQVGMIAVRSRLSQFDRDTLVKLLSQRQDISEDQVNQVIDQFQSTWVGLTHAPQVAVDKTKEQYDKVTTTLADYLRQTRLEELNPEGIQQDLSKLLEDPKEGALALRRRLSRVDRETLVKLLSQRQDLSEEQVNEVIDQTQLAIRRMIKAPRRLAARTQAKVVEFEGTLEEYLRNTEKEELNPEAIKRDLQLLLQHPRAGLEHWSDRFSKVDRSTLVALLAQRRDITPEEANRIVDQIESVRDQFVEQVRRIQSRIQSTIDQIFARIRSYLNALDRPELNYDGIRRDVRQLFSDPQAGFDAIRDRLGHVNRDTVVALLSSRDDISKADADRIVAQVENARDSALQRAERLQQAATQRLEDLKVQAQKQADETRKAAATAAWWLFATSLISAILSALAGAIAVSV
jgi:hypothetical protein